MPHFGADGVGRGKWEVTVDGFTVFYYMFLRVGFLCSMGEGVYRAGSVQQILPCGAECIKGANLLFASVSTVWELKKNRHFFP